MKNIKLRLLTITMIGCFSSAALGAAPTHRALDEAAFANVTYEGQLESGDPCRVTLGKTDKNTITYHRAEKTEKGWTDLNPLSISSQLTAGESYNEADAASGKTVTYSKTENLAKTTATTEISDDFLASVIVAKEEAGKNEAWSCSELIAK